MTHYTDFLSVHSDTEKAYDVRRHLSVDIKMTFARHVLYRALSTLTQL